jgi:hypothetical protein
MSSPHAAGAAALLWSRARRDGLSLSAREVQALLMNYAVPRVDEVGGAFKAAVTRQGAGALDVAAAAQARFLARSGDIAELNFGMHAETGAIGERLLEVEVRNLTKEDIFVLAESRFSGPSDEGRGVFVIVPTEPLRVPAGGTSTFPVRLVFEAGRLFTWPMRDDTATAFLVESVEIDGNVFLTETDEVGVVVADQATASLPFYVMPRRASTVREIAFVPAEGADPPLMLENGSHPGGVELYAVPEVSGGGDSEDPREPELRYELDLHRVGARFNEEGESLDFVLRSFNTAPMQWLTISEVFVDTNGDGLVDHRIRYGSESVLRGGEVRPQMALAVAEWDPDVGRMTSAERVTINAGDDLHSGVQHFEVPWADLGLFGPRPISFWVKRQGVTEDWLNAPDTEIAPNGADALGRGAPRYLLDPLGWSHKPEIWTMTVAAGGRSVINLEPVDGGGDLKPRLLAYLPDNPPGEQLIALGRALDRIPILLPMLLKNY